MSVIKTYTGGFFDLVSPTPAMVSDFDIATALSHLCRFTGHTGVFYSVAQHSVAVSYLVPQDGQHPLVGLLHDATEAYLGDISSPLKALLPDYREVEGRVWAVLCERYKLPATSSWLKEADLFALELERRYHMQSDAGENDYWPAVTYPREGDVRWAIEVIRKPWTADQARQKFLCRLQALLEDARQ